VTPQLIRDGAARKVGIGRRRVVLKGMMDMGHGDELVIADGNSPRRPARAA
jgi:hypothetical protein